MANKPEKIVLDTNILIYFLISESFQKLDKKLKNHDVKLLFSEELLSELIQVASRPKFKKYFSDKDVTNLLNDLHKFADLIEVHSQVNVCRDK